MKTYLIFIRDHNALVNDYTLTIYKTTTDNIYRVIGKIFVTSPVSIKRIGFKEWTQESEKYWEGTGLKIHEYREPILLEDLKMNYELLKLQKDGARLIGKKLSESRKLLNLSVGEVSNTLRIPHYQIRDVERGANNNAVVAMLLADYYDMKGDVFILNEILSSIRYYWYAARGTDET